MICIKESRGRRSELLLLLKEITSFQNLYNCPLDVANAYMDLRASNLQWCWKQLTPAATTTVTMTVRRSL